MKMAGIDVHKKVLMVVVIDASTPEEKPWRPRFSTMPSELHRLLIWLREPGVEEAVMESTAQYGRWVRLELEPHLRLHLAQAISNRAPRGRKHDFKDAERLVRRLIADELILSFVPNGEQRIWRSMTRMKVQVTRDRVRLQNQMECLLEEMRIKLSIVSAIYWVPADYAFGRLWQEARLTPRCWRSWEMSGCNSPRNNWWML